MAGQPNRRPGKPAEPLLDPATGKPAGVGMKAIDHDWESSTDAVELAKRLERKSRQVEKLKGDRADLRIAMKLKTEEAYNEGLLSVAPKLLEIDKKVASITERLLEGSIDEDALKLLKALLPELSKQRDRLYGKTRQRVQSSHVEASVDLNRLMEQGRRGPELLSGDVEPPIDVDVVEEEE